MPTSMVRRNQYRDRVELLQGTLDMLILQTLQWGPQHGYGIMQALRGIPVTFFRSRQALCTPPSIDWSGSAGFARSGNTPRGGSAPSTTRSPQSARNNWPLISAAGSGS
jgi:hypothetical protein